LVFALSDLISSRRLISYIHICIIDMRNLSCVTTFTQDTVVGIGIKLGLDVTGFGSRYEKEIFPFTKPSRPALGPTQPPIELVRWLIPRREGTTYSYIRLLPNLE
jgi:hypothetical protein